MCSSDLGEEYLTSFLKEYLVIPNRLMYKNKAGLMDILWSCLRSLADTSTLPSFLGGMKEFGIRGIVGAILSDCGGV